MSKAWISRRALAVLLTVALGGVFGAESAALGSSRTASNSQVASPFDDYDPALVAELMAEGLSEGEALFIALTDVEVKAVSDDHVRITNTFPTGNEAVIDIRIVPKGSGEPDPLTVKSIPAGKDFEFSLKYPAAVPKDAQPSFALSDGATGSVASLASLGVPSQGPDPYNVQVIVQGLVKRFVGSKASEFVKFLDEKLGTGAKLDGLFKAIKAGLSVKDALKIGSEFDALMAELDALEKCVKNPTNPVTKKEYKKNPSERDQILKAIEGVRAELKGNTAAMFIGTLNKDAAGLLRTVKWLGYVVGPGTAWAIQNFRDVAQARMNEIRKGVVPCTRDYKVDGEALGVHWSATKCGGVAGEWVADLKSPRYRAQGPLHFSFPSEPEAGGSVESGFTEFTFWIDKRDNAPAYEARSLLTFYANGADSTFGSPVGAPLLVVDKHLNGGAPLQVQVGDFCRGPS